MKKTPKQICRKIVAEILAVTLFLTGIPFSSFAEEPPEMLPEICIDPSELEEGGFYLTSVTAELEENRGSSVLLKVCRSSAAETEESVKLVMLDITARYGEDYTVKLYDRGLFEEGVVNPEDGQSIKEAVEISDGDEYNYSDAIIDGSITAESQLTEEEDLEKERQELKEKVEEILTEEDEKQVSGSPLLASVKASKSEAVRKNLTLAQAKELMTGIVNDKEPMSYSDENGNLLSSILGEETEVDPWLTEGKENLTNLLSSAYLTLHFAEGVSVRYIEIVPIDNERSDGDRQVGFSLESVEGSVICKNYADLTLFITDDEEYVPDTVQFSEGQYVPENGYVTVTLERDGALNKIASVMLDSEELTAVPSVNYSEVHTAVYFVYGQKTRTVKIPVTTEGLTADAEFSLIIQEPKGCAIGERNEAICRIRLTDESFAVEAEKTGETETAETTENTGAADSLIPEGSEAKKEELLSGSNYEEIPYDTAIGTTANLSDYNAVFDKTVNLTSTGTAYTSGKSSYKLAGSTFILAAQGEIFGYTRYDMRRTTGEVSARFIDNTLGQGKGRYDWNGFYVLSRNRTSRDSSSVSMSLLDGAGVYHNTETRNNAGWENTAHCIVADFKDVRGLAVSTSTLACTKNPEELSISAIYPVMRLFDIELLEPKEMLLINEKGKKVSTSSIGDRDLLYMNKANLQASNGKNIRTVVTGSVITVYLPDGANSELTGLELVGNGITKRIDTKKGSDGKSLSFTFDSSFLNSCISSNSSYVSFVKNSSGLGGLKGSLKIRPILKAKTVTVKVKNEEHLRISLWDGAGIEKHGSDTDGDGYTEYQYLYGDWVRYTVTMDDTYKQNHVFQGMNVSNRKPDTSAARSGSGYTLVKASGKNYAQEPATMPVTYVWASLSTAENELKVRVPKEQLDRFRLDSGIFLKENHKKKEEEGDYVVYTIDDDAEQIPGKYYELLAETKDKKNIPVWQSGNSRNEYAQPKFYYQGSEDVQENTLTLSTGTADKLRYVIKGKMQYEDTPPDEGISKVSSWLPASGVLVEAGGGNYGISLDDGTYQTGVFFGIKNSLIRLKITAFGKASYQDIKLNTGKTVILSAAEGWTPKDEEVQVIDYSNNTLSQNNADHPHLVEAFVSGSNADNLKQIRIQAKGNASFITVSAMIDSTDSKNQPCSYTISTESGDVTREEHPVKVEFVVLDPVTKEEKEVLTAVRSTEDEDIFRCKFTPVTGNYAKYQADDGLYIRITTDRKTVISARDSVDGKEKVFDTVYPLINTGITFMEEQPKPAAVFSIDFPHAGNRNMELPVIGTLDMLFGFSHFSVGTMQTVNGGIRIFFGGMAGDRYGDYNGGVSKEEIADDGGVYSIKNFPDGIAKSWKEMTKKIEEEKAPTSWALLLKTWSVKPIFGLYLQFSEVYDSVAGTQEYHFDGGGGYAGVLGTFRFNVYFTIKGVPCFFGVSLSSQVTLEFGFKKDRKRDLKPAGDNLNQYISLVLDDTYGFDFVFRFSGTVQAYAGVGICGVLAARGGFEFGAYFLADPNIKNFYPNVSSTGWKVTGTFKLWFDAVLGAIPFSPWGPVLNKTYGYWNDVEKIRNSQLGSAQTEEEECLGAAGASEPAVKKRQGNAEFLANEAQETELLGVSYSRFKEKTILENSYDLIEERVLTYEVNGKEKLLMIYLADDAERADDDRTVLMYTVYDRETDTWTEPAKVNPSGSHADVMPQMTALTGEQEVLITWVSRNRDIADKTSYEQYYTDSQIYTARFSLQAAEEGEDPIHDVRCMTDDAYMNVNPKAVYDSKTGDVLLYFLKAEVPAEINTAEEMLTASMPQTNQAETVYFLYDGQTRSWVTDRYFAGELADESKEAILLEVMKGQRFVPSQIKDFTVDGTTWQINNPAVNDYDVNVVEAMEEGDKNLGVYAFLVDADNSLDTNQDREIFLQTYDFEQHTYSEPMRITQNACAETDLQLVNNHGETWLFWREFSESEDLGESSGTCLNYLELSGLLSGEDISEDIMTADIEAAEGEINGMSFGGYRAFADREGNLLVAWQETASREETKEEEESSIFSTAVYLAGYYPEEDTYSSWSDGIRIAYKEEGNKIYDSLQFASFNDGSICMFSNQYRMVSYENGYETPDSRLVQTAYAPAPSFLATGLEVEEPENPGEDYLIWVEMENEGIRTAKEVSYQGELMLDGEVLDASPYLRLMEEVPAGESTFGPVSVNPGRELDKEEQRRLCLKVRAREDDADLAESVILPLYKELPEYEFEELELFQEDVENFILSGVLKGLDQVEAEETDQLKISDKDGNVLLATSFVEAGLSTGKDENVFYFRLPASELKVSGITADVLIEAERDGESCSGVYSVCGYLITPMCLKINGSSSDTMNICLGQSVNLNGSYLGSEIYRNGNIRYWVKDGSAAEVDGNVLTGKETGSVRLCMAVEPYGGYREITVNVGSGYHTEEESDPSSETVTVKSGPSGAQQLSGNWKQEADGSWFFEKTDGTRAVGWGYTGSGELKEYFHFNAQGVMDSGWYLEPDGTWYYLHETHDGRYGAMDRGWHRDTSDNNWYYLDLITGRMKSGWLQLGKNWYYLGTGPVEATWVQDKKGRWVYKGGKGKPFGAMYANETTPDGYTVGPDGAWKP